MYGTYAWPKGLRDEYLKSKGVDPANPRGMWGERPQPKEHTVDRGHGHAYYFIESIRENKPSREDATEGHAAAGAAHIANLAYRENRKFRWDFRTNKVTSA
jgi:hypothetical protein